MPEKKKRKSTIHISYEDIIDAKNNREHLFDAACFLISAFIKNKTFAQLLLN